MKRLLSLLLVAVIMIFSAGCNGGGGGGGEGSGGSASALDNSNVTLSFDFGEIFAMNNTDENVMLAKLIDFITLTENCYAVPLYDFITSLSIEVTTDGISVMPIYTLDIPQGSSDFKATLTVPNGANRRFYIELKDRNNEVLYSGDLVIDVGSTDGLPQKITVKVYVDEAINADDYVGIGKDYLEEQKLELAFVAFDTAVSIERYHCVARFFRGFSQFILLIQKDDTSVDVTEPNTPITNMLNLYTGIDVYTDTIIIHPDPGKGEEWPAYDGSIAPDIYDNDDEDDDEAGPDIDEDGPIGSYYDKLENFYDNEWKPWYDNDKPALATGDGVDVIENVMLPEIDNVITDLAYADNDPDFSTALTTDMHFGISDEIKVDAADVYILEAIAYGWKADLNHSLAYNQRTNANYWYDEFDKDRVGDLDAEEPYYQGLEYIINNDPGNDDPATLPDPIFDLVGGANAYFNTAKSAYLTGLDKLEAGLELLKKNGGEGGRSDTDKEEENHIFNVVDVEDSILNSHPSLNKLDISKVVTNINETKVALNGPKVISFFDEYSEYKEAAPEKISHTAELDCSTLFDVNYAPDINSRPQFYYHVLGDEDLPVLETNNPDGSSAFIKAFSNVLKEVDGEPFDTESKAERLKTMLREEMLPDGYKFNVPTKTVTMNGNETDFSDFVEPVMLDEEEDDKKPWYDLTNVYMTKGDGYLYVGLKPRGMPYDPANLTGNDWFQYCIYFNADHSNCGWHSSPVIVRLWRDNPYVDWHFDLYSKGGNTPKITSLTDHDCAYDVSGNTVEFKISLDKLKSWVGIYDADNFPTGWDGKEIFVEVSIWSDISGERGGDHVGDCLANLE